MATGAGKTLTALWAISQHLQEQLHGGPLATEQDRDEWRLESPGAARRAGVRILIVAPLRTFDGWQKAWGMTNLPLLFMYPTGEFDTGPRFIGPSYKCDKGPIQLDPGIRAWFIGWEKLRSLGTQRDKGREKDVSRGAGAGANNSGTLRGGAGLVPPGRLLGGGVWDWVIFDEGHRAANRSSLTYKVASRLRRKHTLFLSATPAGDRPANMSGVLELAFPGTVPRRNEFEERYFTSVVNPFGSGPWSRIYGAEKNPGAAKRLAKCWVDVTDKQVRGAFPLPNVVRVDCPLTREQKKIYKDLKQLGVAWLGEHPVAVDIPAHLDMRLRQATLAQPTVLGLDDRGVPLLGFSPDARSSKIEAVKDILQDLPEDEPVIIYTHSKRFLVPLVMQLSKHMNPKVYKKVGAESGLAAGNSGVISEKEGADSRADSVSERLISGTARVGQACGVLQVSGSVKDQWQQWRDGQGRILCAVISAIGEGVDGLQHRAHTEIWMSQDNRVILNKQAAGRLDRQGQTRRVTRYLLQSPGTVDTEAVAPRLERKYQDLADSGLI